MTTHPIEGVDYSWSHPDPAALAGLGIKFACRYVGGSHGKRITRAEAEALAAVGISVVTNWELSAGRPQAGREAGEADAIDAHAQSVAAGAPADRPIYFSVDYDARGRGLTRALEYLDGAAAAIGRDRVGVYGGIAVITGAHDAGYRWLWQTYAWSAGEWHPAALIQQYRNNVQLAGATVDLNRAADADFGGWRLGSLPAPIPLPGPEEDPMQLLYRHEAYADEFLIGAAPPIHVSPEVRGALIAGGVTEVTDRNDQQLEQVLAQSGFRRNALTPI